MQCLSSCILFYVFVKSIAVPSLAISLFFFFADFAVCRNFSWDDGQFRVSNQQFHRYTEGTRVDITCDNGYHPTLSVSYAICAANGQWTPHTPACSGNVQWNLQTRDTMGTTTSSLVERSSLSQKSNNTLKYY